MKMTAMSCLRVFPVVVLLAAAGCSGPETASLPESAVIPGSDADPRPSPTPQSWFGGENVYRVGPGDVLKVTVYGEEDLSGLFRISPEGTISWSWVGEVRAAGQTETEILEELRGILTRDYIRQPRVDLSIAEYQSQVVYFFGNVRHPGIRRLGENRSLLANFLQTGGPKVWGNSQIGILRTKPGGGDQDQISIALQSLMGGEKDILLQDQDIITVSAPEAASAFTGDDRVYVLGAVNGPGSFRWVEQMTALDALLEAGGLADYASGNRARLVRGQGEEKREIQVRLQDILEGDRSQNQGLLPGDLLIVPESWF
ncbi:MAG: polysaccharide biosynthesis/export family protein [Candidatus Erginobacter occultus]|nr:polysaccharide biosynthesis/export family protein [Candidatus Erginobacter occultus]